MSTGKGQSRNRIELEGEWDLSRKDELKRILDSIQKDGPLTIDLRRVTYADSTFLSFLASLALRFQDVPIRLLSPSPSLARILGIVQFEKLFQIVNEP